MKLRTLAATAVVAVTVAACGGSGGEHYPANIETNFLNSCESNGGSSNGCDCALHWLEDHESLTQFKADEDDAANGSIPDNFRKAVNACRS